MDRFFGAILHHKKTVLILFILFLALSGVLAPMVPIQYDLVEYLPEDAPSTQAIELMDTAFDAPQPNARILLNDVSLLDALDYKEKLAAIEGVSSVVWLDDVLGKDLLMTTPLTYLDSSIVELYYKDGKARLEFTIESGKESPVMDAIYALIGESNAAAGQAVNVAETQAMSVTEVLNAMALLLPILLVILILTTDSWIEPVLFLASIGVAILINMGTNLFFGEVSFITRTVSPVLQLAVSLDYAIFLLHSYRSFKQQLAPEEAMKAAIRQSFSTVAASAATTVIGFAALIFMRFGIGADLGVNLLKGVLLSFISVMIFMPVLTLMLDRAIEKTRHRVFLPEFKKTGKWLMNLRIPIFLLALLVVLPAYLAQTGTEFTYGTGSVAESTRAGTDAKTIQETFDNSNLMVLLFPQEEKGKESELCEALSALPHVTNALSYVTAVGAEIPSEFVPKDAVSSFYSKEYARIVLYTDTPEEGEEAFTLVESIMDTADRTLDSFYLTGQSAILYDMKQTVTADTALVNWIAVIGIFVVLLLTFRSATLPFILIFTIETAIWVNLSVPYFTGTALTYIGYLIISTVQLGATVDYAILITNRYLDYRTRLSKKEALRTTLQHNFLSILTSGAILSTSGFALAFTSSNPIVSEMGTLLGRGTLLSLLMVSAALPAMLLLFDRLIEKTTLHCHFHREQEVSK